MEFIRVKNVEALPNYELRLTFSNGKIKKFDTRPYLKNFFEELKDVNYFNKVRVCFGSIQWPNEQDFCPDMLYAESEEI